MKNVMNKLEERFLSLPYWAIDLIVALCGVVFIVVIVFISAFFANIIGNILYIFVPEASFETMHLIALFFMKGICLAVVLILLHIVKKFE